MANQYTSELIRPRNIAAADPITRCFVCRERATPNVNAVFRRMPFMVCLSCRLRYEDVVQQAQSCGRRFRFVLKTEIPHPDELGINEQNTGFRPYRATRQIYKVLMLLKEREEKLQKEVNWMVDETALRMLRLPQRAAEAMKNTYVIRGDDATEADDVALLKIKDLLEEINPEIFRQRRPRRKKKGFPKP